MKLDENKARFVVKSFRKTESYINKYLEGELREVVELRVPAVVLDKLICEKKVKEQGGMIFFPRLLIGANNTYGKDESGDRDPKAITDKEADELEQGMGEMRELLVSDPMQALSELAIETYDQPSSTKNPAAPKQLALQEASCVIQCHRLKLDHICFGFVAQWLFCYF